MNIQQAPEWGCVKMQPPGFNMEPVGHKMRVHFDGGSWEQERLAGEDLLRWGRLRSYHPGALTAESFSAALKEMYPRDRMKQLTYGSGQWFPDRYCPPDTIYMAHPQYESLQRLLNTAPRRAKLDSDMLRTVTREPDRHEARAAEYARLGLTPPPLK